MNRRQFLKTSATGLAAAALGSRLSGGETPGSNRPNVLFIAVDDFKPLAGCYGAPWIHSPNIDRLAGKGMVFNRAYCQYALCTASRVSLLTGLRPDTTGIYTSKQLRAQVPKAVTLPEYFKRNGYTTQAIGKVFDARNVDRKHDTASWSEPYVPDAAYVYNSSTGIPVRGCLDPKAQADLKKHMGPVGINDPKLIRFVPVTECLDHDVPDNAYEDGAMTDRAVSLLGNLAGRGKPFFLAVGMHKPHLPFIAPKKYWDLYDPAVFQLAQNPNYPTNSPEIAHLTYHEAQTYGGIPHHGPVPEDIQRRLLHGYAACISYMDAQVGRLLQALEDSGQANNTIVWLWADHGWHLGDKSEWGKWTTYEQATHVTSIVAPPQFPKGMKSDSLVEHVDIYPTLCDLASLPIPAFCQGTSLKPILSDPGAQVKKASISQLLHQGVLGWAVRSDRYRYVEWRNFNEAQGMSGVSPEVLAVELYDYEKDPLEIANHAAEPDYAPILRQHQALFDQLLPHVPKRSSV